MAELEWLVAACERVDCVYEVGELAESVVESVAVEIAGCESVAAFVVVGAVEFGSEMIDGFAEAAFAESFAAGTVEVVVEAAEVAIASVVAAFVVEI